VRRYEHLAASGLLPGAAGADVIVLRSRNLYIFGIGFAWAINYTPTNIRFKG